MSVFNNDIRSGYDELKTYYPTFYYNVKEMDVNLQFAGWLLDIMADGLERLVANQFVSSMDEEMINRMEVFLSLTANKSRPLPERKKMIAATMVGYGKISGSRIKEIIKSFVESDVDVSLADEYLTIIITRTSKEFTILYMNDIDTILNKRLPAHIAKKVINQFSWPVTIQSSLSKWIIDYPICGVTPENALIGAARSNKINSKVSELDVTFNYTLAGDKEAGTYPDISTLGEDMKNSLSANSTVSTYSLDYTACGTKYSGEEGL